MDYKKYRSLKSSDFRFRLLALNLFLLFPFIPNVFQIFNSSVYEVFIIWKCIAIVLCIFVLFLKKGLNYRFDNFTVLLLISFSFLLLSTALHNGNNAKYFGFLVDSLGICILFQFLFGLYGINEFKYTAIFSRIILYANFVLLILFPNGIFIGHTMDLVVRYNFLGMDNQCASIVIPLGAIMLAYDFFYKRKKLLLADALVIVCTLLFLWVATAIVGALVFIALVMLRIFFNKNFNLKEGIICSFILFILVVYFKIYNLMSFLIVNILGKTLGLSGRVELWDSATKTWLEYPVLGHGIQNSELLVYFTIMKDYRHAHNEYLQLLINGGLIFFVLFFCLLFVVAKKADFYIHRIDVFLMCSGITVYLIMCIGDVYGHLVGLYILLSTVYYYSESIKNETTRKKLYI